MDRIENIKLKRWIQSSPRLSLEDTPSKKNFGFSEKKIEGGSSELRIQKSTEFEYMAFFKFLAAQLVLEKLLVRIQPPHKLLFIKKGK